MPKINVLPKEIYSLIAAGEVVERPSSVVKEMLENSIDAGAKRVTVEIRSGGVTFLRVTDDGCGIAPEDVKNAFVSHATSKISKQSDLDAIATLGFRGEALASVAAVSRIEMLTRMQDADFGTRYVIECGEEKTKEESGCPVGTTIIVRDLFCNTPARMKFLKKDTTEGNYVADVVTKTALSHPEISFRLIRDGKETVQTPGSGKMYDAIYSLFGRDFAEGLAECDYELDGIRVRGFVTKPLFGRPNRNMQYFYVNQRYVRIPTAAAALDEAFKNNIMVGKFPGAVLNIDIAPGSVDVNVHPAKTEIRFSNDRRVFEAVFYAAKSALAKGDTRPSFSVNKQTPRPAVAQTQGSQISFAQRTESAWGIKPTEVKKVTEKQPPVDHPRTVYTVPDTKRTAVSVMAAVEDGVEKTQQTEEKQPAVTGFVTTVTQKALSETLQGQAPPVVLQDSAPSFVQTAKKVLEAQKQTRNSAIPIDEEKNEEPQCVKTETEIPLRIVGELFKTYILAEYGDKFIICDKHAAHERILFEKIKKNAQTGNTQMLLMPVRVALSGGEYDAVLENLILFEKAGYMIEDFGVGTVIVRGAPLELANADISSLVCELAGELKKGKLSMMPERLDWLYHNTACRAAIKAGDSTNPIEQAELIRMVLSDDNIRYCPHGRPVLTEITRYELEKQFGRLG
ncbi:MAG: DNA mismatch repair endonuclease MutL [Ruminococcaceae bacterium]|nr:DNA mismatch repair endonuclease MutL [Oscillospiraceae bacterium]